MRVETLPKATEGDIGLEPLFKGSRHGAFSGTAELMYIHAIEYKLLEDRNQVSLTSDFAISPESGIVGITQCWQTKWHGEVCNNHILSNKDHTDITHTLT